MGSNTEKIERVNGKQQAKNSNLSQKDFIQRVSMATTKQWENFIKICSAMMWRKQNSAFEDKMKTGSQTGKPETHERWEDWK